VARSFAGKAAIARLGKGKDAVGHQAERDGRQQQRPKRLLRKLLQRAAQPFGRVGVVAERGDDQEEGDDAEDHGERRQPQPAEQQDRALAGGGHLTALEVIRGSPGML
jgi:hypothetical protein